MVYEFLPGKYSIANFPWKRILWIVGEKKNQQTDLSFWNFWTNLSQKLPNFSASIGKPDANVFQIVPKSWIIYFGIPKIFETIVGLLKKIRALLPI